VRWLGAVQSQDYPAAKWGVGQRMTNGSDAALDMAFATGTILRTHLMRPTWHFVLPADIAWMLTLTGPRVNAACASYYRKFDLDDRLLAKGRAALVSALQGGRHLTRPALRAALEKARVITRTDSPLRVMWVLLRAELDAVICSGPRVGKQFTYALLVERAPDARTLPRDEAAAELARRYFLSHGPATVKDFMWWSSLAAADARVGLAAVAPELVEVVVDGSSYWSPPPPRKTKQDAAGTAYLLAAYDEGLLSYRDNRPGLAAHGPQLMRDNGAAVVIDGRVVGTWRRSVTRDAVTIAATPFDSFSRRQIRAVEEAAERYGRFLELSVSVRYR
jgi:DNA glycosylase AlkZ-like